MDPNIYFAYLCFLDHHGPVREAFKEWKKQSQSNSIYSSPYSCLEREMQNICWAMAVKYKHLYIYEAEKAWTNFSTSRFIRFLEGLGFKK